MTRTRKITIFTILALLLLGAGAYMARDWIERQFFRPTDSTIENGVTVGSGNSVQVIAQGLTVPWGIAFMPNGDVMVTERSGTLRRIDGGQTHNIEGVRHIGEGGLLGLELHPDFEQNRQLYLYLTTETEDGLTNRVERYRYQNDRLSERTVILDNIPGAANHDGGRIAFGPDGYLYIATGDAGNEQSAQDTNSLAGKILRITEEGSAPGDNPFGNEVYSYGHRNPQGLAWDDEEQLWSSEHGRSGVQSGYDEINLIKKGANYGWPVIEGDETRDGMEAPVVHSGADETWAPASLAYRDGSLFFGGLRGETLYEAIIRSASELDLRGHFRNEYGRIRTVVFSPDDQLYLTTSNTDGRGDQRPNDDQIIRINPEIFD